jgi:hypothetical protein
MDQVWLSSWLVSLVSLFSWFVDTERSMLAEATSKIWTWLESVIVAIPNVNLRNLIIKLHTAGSHAEGCGGHVAPRFGPLIEDRFAVLGVVVRPRNFLATGGSRCPSEDVRVAPKRVV